MGYPLKQFEIETAPVSVRASPFNATEYRIEPGRHYEVVAYEDDGRGILGTGTVDGRPGAFTVEPNFPLNEEQASGAFWAVWDVDDDGIARLQRVLLQLE